MISANELRIGNYVNHKSEGISRVTEIESHKNHIGVTPLSFNNYVFMCPEIKPIPLTPEILEKCGFEKRFIKNDICYCLPYLRPSGKKQMHDIVLVNFGTFDNNLKNVYAFAIKEYDRNIQFAVTYIKNVHQLQNLYFALTGEELIYKP